MSDEEMPPSADRLRVTEIGATILSQEMANTRLRNKVQGLEQMPGSIFVPVYLRGVLTELIYVTAAEKKVRVRCSFFVSYPSKIPAHLVRQSGSQQIYRQQEIQELNQYLSQNFSLSIAGKQIDITPHYSLSPVKINQDRILLRGGVPEQHQENSIERRLGRGMSKDYSVDDKIKGEQSQEEEEQSQQQDEEQLFYEGCYVAKVEEGTDDYSTFLVEGLFDCQGEMSSFFFPYHEIFAKIPVETRSLYYKDITLRFHFVTLSPMERFWSSHFFIKIRQESWRRFGIYEIDHSVGEIEPSISPAGQHPVFGVIGLHYPFRIFSYNMPFILRTSVILWFIYLAAMLMFFVQVDSIAEIYGNVLLFGVVGVELLSNYMASVYRDYRGSIYTLTIAGILLVPMVIMITETALYYDLDEPPERELITAEAAFVLCLVVSSLLFIISVATLIYFGLKARAIRRSNNSLNVRDHLVWGVEIFESCVSFPEARVLKRRLKDSH